MIAVRNGRGARAHLVGLGAYGNISAASIPLAMVEAREAGRLRAGDLVLLVGFGARLTWGSTVVRYEPR